MRRRVPAECHDHVRLAGVSAVIISLARQGGSRRVERAQNATVRSERLVALLFLLQRRRAATVPELAQALGVSERTTYRDVAALQAAGVPIWTEQGRGGGVRLVDGWRSQLDGLTSREAVALFAFGAPQALAALGLGSAVAAAHAKVAASLPEALREQAEVVAQRFHLDAPAWFRAQEESEALGLLAQAVWEQRRVRVAYRRGSGTGEAVERLLEPLGVVLKAGVWYLVAAVEGITRTYRVARVERVEVTDERFARPAGFDLAAWWRQSAASFEQSLQTVQLRLRLSRRGVRALPGAVGEQVAAAALDRAGQPDDAGWVTVDVALEDEEIAAHQLLGLGDDVVIEAPAGARRALAELARRILDRHDDGAAQAQR